METAARDCDAFGVFTLAAVGAVAGVASGMMSGAGAAAGGL
ncbi:MAG: hypothetical protein R3C42_03985 [Parvularculaceae bacterium]